MPDMEKKPVCSQHSQTKYSRTPHSCENTPL